MNQRHLSDDRLIELSLGRAAAADDHLESCAECRARHACLRKVLNEIDTAVADEADMVFTADRLARQHARILQRVIQDGRPARVLAFPAANVSEHMRLRSRPVSRWVAAAAVAGLVVGLLAGRLSHTIPAPGGPAPQFATDDAGPSPLRAVSTTLSDDELLGQLETVASGGPAALRPLDALTPRAWDVH